MSIETTVSVESIRQARIDNPKLRERDLAGQLSISEAQLVAAHCGEGVVRIEPRVEELLRGLESVGEVMALTRNESAVHEKIGVYDKIFSGPHSAMVLGSEIDLRIFPKAWAHGFAVEKRDGDDFRRSLQFFDQAGDAVHKIHLRPASNLYAFHKLVSDLASDDQRPGLVVGSRKAAQRKINSAAQPEELRQRWSAMTDVHQFVGILKNLDIDRRQALDLVGEDYAWQLDGDALTAMFAHVVDQQIPMMCFVGNHGCIQIHSGPIANVKPMGPWINVMDPTFHLHLRQDHIHELWGVRKPNKDGHVTSLEAYNRDGEMIIQFFGKRSEGQGERSDWRMIAENLPRIRRSTAA